MKRSPFFFAFVAFLLSASPALADLATAAIGAGASAGVLAAAMVGLVVGAPVASAVAVGIGVGALAVGMLGLVTAGLDASFPLDSSNPSNGSALMNVRLVPNTGEQDTALNNQQQAFDNGGLDPAPGSSFVASNGKKGSTPLKAFEASLDAGSTLSCPDCSFGATDPSCVPSETVSCHYGGVAQKADGSLVSVGGYLKGDSCPTGTTLTNGTCDVPNNPASPVAVNSGGKLTVQPEAVAYDRNWRQNANGSWTNNDAQGNSTYISGDGKSMTVTKPDGTSAVVQYQSDGSMNASAIAHVPVFNSQGQPVTITSVETRAYNAQGQPSGMAVTQVSPTDSNGQTFDPNAYSLAPSAGGNGQTVAQQSSGMPSGSGASGGSSGGGTGTSGTGSCASGDCSTETTQKANNGLLQKISDALTGSGTASTDPTPRTGGDIQGLLDSAFSDLDSLRGWTLPQHQSQCPTGEFQFPFTDTFITFDPGCDFATQNIGLLSVSFIIFWNLAAVFIVLRA